ncbi:MAG TPA: choice-of-anchor N protein [Planctomycetaceae bacterium]|nr:choice-of-anchor N protein [Planctomycetaceae bacterium]
MFRLAAQTLVAFAVLTGGVAHAIPILQLYIEGATYDSSTESWVYDASTSDTPTVIRLWTIGNVVGPGGQGAITNVRLAVAYHAQVETESGYEIFVNLAGSTTGGFGGVADPSQPDDATKIQKVTDGSTPLLSDGTPLATHGVYGTNSDGTVKTYWQEFALGDFTLTDSHIGDFIKSFPEAENLYPDAGQINVYEVRVETLNPATPTVQLHFDLYDTIQAENTALAKSVFAPFSHDAEGGIVTTLVPEPSSLALTLIGALGCGAVAARRKRRLAKSARSSTSA